MALRIWQPDATGGGREIVPHCETCKWWIAEGETLDPARGICGALETYSGGKEGCKAEITYSDSNLETDPDFGCTEWEPRS